MSPEGLALMWFAAVNLVWALIFTGVVVFALRTDTERAGARPPARDPGDQPSRDTGRRLPDRRPPRRRGPSPHHERPVRASKARNF